jgi:hypothetical protein
MKTTILRNVLIIIVLVIFMPCAAFADDTRSLALDLYLIIDGSSTLENSKDDTIAWICDQVVDRFLIDGDKISIWTAGDTAQLIYSDTVSGAAGKEALKARLRSLDTSGQRADFSGALREAASRASQTGAGRLPYTLLVTASAEALGPALTGSDQALFRWFRSEKYERWQVLVVAPNIGTKVRQAASAYMGSLR